ncbi:MAG: polysaccharide deacetylase family protein [Gemmatimonadota bacterium]
MTSFRTIAKRAIERLAVLARADRLGLSARKPGDLVLAYHNVVPDAADRQGDASLHLPIAHFRRQLDLLQEWFDVVPLEELVGPSDVAHTTRPRVALTFDDAYRGVFELALPEMGERGLPGTVFVAPGILGDRTLWWDALGREGWGGPPPAIRAQILELGGSHESARRVAAAENLEWIEMPPVMRTVTEAELSRAELPSYVSLGSHTWSHTSLLRLGPQDLQNELALPRAWLTTRFPERFNDVLSYPFGHCSEEVAKAAEDAGYRAGMSLHAGTLPDSPSGFQLPRRNIPAGLSLDGLRLRLAWR